MDGRGRASTVSREPARAFAGGTGRGYCVGCSRSPGKHRPGENHDLLTKFGDWIPRVLASLPADCRFLP